MKNLLTILLVGVLTSATMLALTSCKDKGETTKAPGAPAAPPTPPPPTAESIASEIRNEIQGLLNGPGQSEQALAALRKAQQKYQFQKTGTEALRMIRRELLAKFDEANQQRRWRWVLDLAPAVAFMAPDDKRIERYTNRAKAELYRPRIKGLGQMTDSETDQITVHLEITLPQTGKTYRTFVREGEDILDDNDKPTGLHLDKVIGVRNKKAIIHYALLEEAIEVDIP